MDREAWHAAVHVVTKSWTWLSDWTELNWIGRGRIHRRGEHRQTEKVMWTQVETGLRVGLCWGQMESSVVDAAMLASVCRGPCGEPTLDLCPCHHWPLCSRAHWTMTGVAGERGWLVLTELVISAPWLFKSFSAKVPFGEHSYGTQISSWFSLSYLRSLITRSPPSPPALVSF